MNAAPRYRVATSIAPVPPPNPGALSTDFFAGMIPANEQYRPHFGRSLDLDKIDYAIRAANTGLMHRMTDLSRETIMLDGHVSSLLQKRLNRVGALDWDIQPATGVGIDEGRAKERAAEVRENIAMIPNFRDRLIDMAWGNFDGRACSEIEWFRMGMSWRVRNLHWIHPRRLSFGPHRDIRVVDPMRATGNFIEQGFAVECVPYKFVTFKPRIFGDYQEREGLAARTLYWSFFQRLGVRERLELMEIFGKPWRILIPKVGVGVPPINKDALDEGFRALNQLGFYNTARMPAAMEVQVVQPNEGAGQVHDQAILDARAVLTKMFLGGVATTDAVSTGLGSSIGDVHLSEEDLIIASDARRIAECVEDQLTDAIVVANYGPHEVTHAPKFVIRTDPPVDRKAEGERIKAALDVGLHIAAEEARDRLGFREIRADEAYLARVARTPELGQVAQPPQPELVYPVGEAPPPGELQDVPDVAINLPPGAVPGATHGALPGGPVVPALPPGEAGVPGLAATPGAGDLAEDDLDDPDDDDVAQLAAQMTELRIEKCAHNKPNRCRICGVERKREVTRDPVTNEAVWSVAWKPIGRRTSSPTLAPAALPAAAPA